MKEVLSYMLRMVNYPPYTLPACAEGRQALEDDDGRIMVVEWIPDNYPAVGIFTYESKTEYAESVKDVNWVTERSNINDEELAGMLADALTDNDVAINRET